MATKAKSFSSCRSQAVRLPKEVRSRPRGSAVVRETVPAEWDWLDAIAGKLDRDMVAAIKEKPKRQERPSLDMLFR